MRDLLITLIVLGSIPFILRNPFTGLLMWVWLGVMNPHKLAYGWASDMPFAQIVAICTLLSMLFNASKLYSFPKDRVTIALIMFVLWMGVSPFFSFHPELEFELWSKPFKVIFMALVSLMLVGNRDQIQKLVWVLVLSLAFYGVKGGIFTIATGGHYRVWGPGGAIGDNNQLALALIMMLPLFRYGQMHAGNRLIHWGAMAGMVLSTISAIGSQSRGAFLALAAMGVFLWLKTRQKGLVGFLIIAALPLAWLLMPESWSERMSTIQTYQQDSSAMDRINAWTTAWNAAVDRFPIGVGFDFNCAEVFNRYAPDPTSIFVAHSIYFEVLGQHGFIGLTIFLMVFGFAWLNFSWIIQNCKKLDDMEWARDLAAMCQVSLVGYAVGGAFLNLSYFDLPYYIAVISIILRRLLRAEHANIDIPSSISMETLNK